MLRTPVETGAGHTPPEFLIGAEFRRQRCVWPLRSPGSHWSNNAVATDCVLVDVLRLWRSVSRSSLVAAAGQDVRRSQGD